MVIMQARRASSSLYLGNCLKQKTPDETQARRAAKDLSQSNCHDQETPNETQAQRAAQTLSQAIHREMETEDQTQRRLASNSQRRHAVQDSQSQVIRKKAINFEETEVDAHSCGILDVVYQFFGSKILLLSVHQTESAPVSVEKRN
jgi:hypothetical protein